MTAVSLHSLVLFLAASIFTAAAKKRLKLSHSRENRFVSIHIVEETLCLDQYQNVPISFEVRSKFDIYKDDDDNFSFVEEEVASYIKDYDSIEKPTAWSDRFDVRNWGFFAAFDHEQRVGSAAIAWKTRDLGMLEGRSDLACLWDVRVSPGYRGRRIGKLLFEAAANWARARGCNKLKIETQDINVPACRFYARQGCILQQVNPNAYPAEMNEIQLIWYLDL
jgi:GNAT superfamily N-acetyltransferase